MVGAGRDRRRCGTSRVCRVLDQFCVAIDGSGRAFTYIAGRWQRGARWTPPWCGATHGGADVRVLSEPVLCMAVPRGTQTATGQGVGLRPGVGSRRRHARRTAAAIVVVLELDVLRDVDGEGDSFMYNGARWSATSGAWGGTSALSCVSPTFCVATEGGGIAGWNGSTWSQPGSQDQTGQLLSVSCTSPPSASRATGWACDRWNGSSWGAAPRWSTGPGPRPPEHGDGHVVRRVDVLLGHRQRRKGIRVQRPRLVDAGPRRHGSDAQLGLVRVVDVLRRGRRNGEGVRLPLRPAASLRGSVHRLRCRWRRGTRGCGAAELWTDHSPMIDRGQRRRERRRWRRDVWWECHRTARPGRRSGRSRETTPPATAWRRSRGRADRC